jgi:hypothetical protein
LAVVSAESRHEAEINFRKRSMIALNEIKPLAANKLCGGLLRSRLQRRQQIVGQ